MQEIGVMAVVQGLAGFTSDMNKIGGLLDMLKPKATGLMNFFEDTGDAIGNFGESILRVAEVALGVMLRDAIEWVIGGLKDMATAAVEAGAEFQLLEMRLTGLNLQKGVDAGLDYADAMTQATEATKEQLVWIMQLASVTPFDATDIANVFTLSTSYGFATDEAKQLTESIMDFTAAMGLDSVAMERIIVNFGQMVQRGKITTRELNDLARGSMMPIADVLEIIAERMGISVKKLTEEISKPGGGVDAQYFIDAFNEMIDTQARFQGSSERMARTFRGAMENVQQTTRDLLGFYVMQPVLDVLGERVAGILDELTKPENWERITTALGGIGEGLADIVEGILGITPEPGNFVDWLMEKIDAIKVWIDTHKQGIIEFFDNLKHIISGTPEEITLGVVNTGSPLGIDWEEMLPHEEFGTGILAAVQDIANFIRNELVPAFDKIRAWVEENKPLIDEFFKTLGWIATEVVKGLLEGFGIGGGEGEGGMLDMLKSFLQWVVDNKEMIAGFIEEFAKFVAFYVIFSTGSTIVATMLIDLFGVILALISAGGLISVGSFFLAMLALMDSEKAIAAVGVASALRDTLTILTDLTGLNFVQAASDVVTFFETLKTIDVKSTAETWGRNLMDGFVSWLETQIGTILPRVEASIRTLFSNLDMADMGATVGDSFIAGIVKGIEDGTGAVVDAVRTIVSNMIGAIMDLLDAKSPSKVMADIGENVIGGGLAEGIESFVGPLMNTMSTAMRNITTAAATVPSQTSTSYQYNSSYNLTINSNANAEQVAADFGMMQSLAGV